MNISKRKNFIAAASLAAVAAVSARYADASTASFGGSYTQNFDSLPFTQGAEVNTNNPVTIGGTEYTFNNSANTAFDFAASPDNSGTVAGSTGGLGLSASMPGWYGSAFGTTSSIKFGASAGLQTTGGVVSFGTAGGAGSLDSNRALGLLASSSVGNTEFGVQLINNTGGTINSVNLQFVEELWHQQTATQTMEMSELVEPASGSNTLPIPGTTAGLTQFDSFGGTTTAGQTFTTGAKNTLAQTTGPLATNNYNNTVNLSSTPWLNGDALWLVWSTTVVGSAQGFAVDNLSITSGVPEPTSLGLMAIAGVGLLARRRQAAK